MAVYSPPRGKLLAQHLPGLSLDIEGGDILAGHGGDDAPPGPTKADTGAQTARNQGDHHGAAENQNMPPKTNFLNGPGVCRKRIIFLSLQKLQAESSIINYGAGPRGARRLARGRRMKVWRSENPRTTDAGPEIAAPH